VSFDASNIVARSSTFSLDVVLLDVSLEGGRHRLALAARGIGRRLEVAIVIVIGLNVVFVAADTTALGGRLAGVACVYNRTILGRNVLYRDCLPIIVVANINVKDFFRAG
jgi:hypothetical protein